jgi:hypothetical protein
VLAERKAKNKTPKGLVVNLKEPLDLHFVLAERKTKNKTPKGLVGVEDIPKRVVLW